MLPFTIQLCSEDGPAEQSTVSCSRSAQQVATSHMSHQPMLPAGKPGLFTWNTTVLFEVSEPTMQWKLMIIGMTAEYAGPLLSRMLVRKLVEKPDKKTNRYQITQKGQEFLVKPPPPETIIGKKPETKAETKVEAKVENKVKEIPKEVPKEIPKEIPSQPPSKTRRAYSLNCRPKHAGRIP